ncbi:MAG TPA: hypothetical protein VLL76_02160, partial [Candidatus Omnitrophota bacterium]|nr:hypothetical protein [Candidatus Omnitrophota bacterium]
AAAEQLDRVSNYLRQSDWNDILVGAENFARRQPYWFVGGAVAAGFLMARFLKSSGGMEAIEQGGYASRRRTAQPSASTYTGGSTTAPGYGSSTTSPYTTTMPGTTTTPAAGTGDLT